MSKCNNVEMVTILVTMPGDGLASVLPDALKKIARREHCTIDSTFGKDGVLTYRMNPKPRRVVVPIGVARRKPISTSTPTPLAAALHHDVVVPLHAGFARYC